MGRKNIMKGSKLFNLTYITSTSIAAIDFKVMFEYQWEVRF